MSVIFETQKAVFSKLSGDSALLGLVHGVYDFVQEGSEYPYVTIGDIKAGDDSVLGLKGFKLVMNVNVYSQGQGKAECLGIIDRLKVLLDGQPLVITGYSHIYSKVDAITTKRNSDNVTLAGQVSITILVRVA